MEWSNTMNRSVKWILGAAGSASDRSPRSADLSAPTVTVTKTVPNMEAPQSCLDALDAAEALTKDAGDFASTVTAYPDLIRRAAIAGSTFDTAGIEAITRKIESMSVEIRAETDSVDMHGDRFRATAADCRAGA
jgi:hypothetical protein